MGVYKRGKQWGISYTYHGKRIRKIISDTKQGAEAYLGEIQKKIFLGELGVETLIAITFPEFSKEYLEKHSKLKKSKKSFIRDRGIIRNYFIPFFQDWQPSKIDTFQIESYVNQRLEQGAKEATVNKELNLLSNMMNRAIQRNYATHNPVSQFGRLKEKSSKTVQYFTREQIAKLLQEADSGMSWFITMALHTGMRMGELWALEWGDVDLKQGLITVDNKEGHHTKNYEARHIPIHPELRKAINARPTPLKREQKVFGDMYIHQDSLSRKFRQLCKTLGFPGHAHMLRHTFASYLVMGGTDLTAVQRLLGHHSIKVTEKYAHLAPDHMRHAIHRLDFSEENSEKVAQKWHMENV